MRLKKLLSFSVTAMTAWVFLVFIVSGGGVQAAEESEGRVLAIIGSNRITSKDLEERLQRLSPVLREDYSSEEGMQRLLKELVRIEVFSMEAQEQGLDKTPRFQKKLTEVRKALLADQFTKDKILSGDRATEDNAREYYVQHAMEFQSPEQIRVTSIFLQWSPIATADEKAKKRSLSEEIIRRARNGEDFLELARRHSSKPLDDDAVYFSRGRYVPEIEEKLFALSQGELCPVIEVEGGLLIFRMEERLAEGKQPYEAVRKDIVAKLRTENSLKDFEKAERRLFAKYNVHFPADEPSVRNKEAASMKDRKSPAIEGTITKVTRAAKEAQKAGGKGTIFVEAKSNSAQGEDRMSIGITAKTRIFREKNGRSIEAAFDDLNEGLEVQVFISGPVGMSYPVQADADMILILGEGSE
ncbi:MAG: peptidylprolyl isomerase [Syntrophobacteraceae bacterium]